MRFDAELQLNGKTATGVPVPRAVLDGLGGGRRPRVTVSLNGYEFQTTLGTMSGEVLIPVSAAIRAAAGVAAGDRLGVGIELCTEPAQVSVPDDLRTALAAEPPVQAFFDGLTASQRRAYAEPIDQAKKPATRQRRLDQTMDALRARRTRPARR